MKAVLRRCERKEDEKTRRTSKKERINQEKVRPLRAHKVYRERARTFFIFDPRRVAASVWLSGVKVLRPSLSIFLSFVDWTAGKGLVFAKMVLPGVFYLLD